MVDPKTAEKTGAKDRALKTCRLYWLILLSCLNVFEQCHTPMIQNKYFVPYVILKCYISSSLSFHNQTSL